MTLREILHFKNKLANLEANNLKREGFSLDDSKKISHAQVEQQQIQILLYEILRELRRIK